jgi:hypothetical protein
MPSNFSIERVTTHVLEGNEFIFHSDELQSFFVLQIHINVAVTIKSRWWL